MRCQWGAVSLPTVKATRYNDKSEATNPISQGSPARVGRYKERERPLAPWLGGVEKEREHLISLRR